MLEQLAQYKILDRIGAGGLGEVYRARDTRLGRTVAIKVLPPDVAGDPARRDRFMREAQAAAALSHPNIAALFEIGEDQGQLFLAFEFIAGHPLTKEIGGRPMNPRQAIHLAVQIADALADAHAEGIVHRDIKPDNIIVTPKGNAKVLDFGLASWTAGGGERERAATLLETGAGAAIGTVAYMSPEQALGESVDHRTDIFSLGIVLHEMLTGSRPFHAASATALALQIVQAPAPPPSSVDRHVPVELDVIVARMLAKKIDGRYGSAAALAAELRAVDAILDVRSEATERAIAAAASSRPARAIGRWIAVAAVLAAMAGGLWYARAPLARQWKRSLGPLPPPVVAVIPLELADPDRSQQFFAAGLTEDLVTRLGQTAGLKVPGRSATRNDRGRPPADLAHELGAGVVLTGTVRLSGDTMNLSLELIDPSDGTALWTGQYTREVRSIFAVQAQVADEVATALKVTLQPTAARERAASRLVDPRAYETYLRGRQAASERNVDAAKHLFAQAIQLDEGLAEAHAGLAEALRLEASLAGVDAAVRRAAMKRAADRAFEIDPDLPQANLAVALTADSLPDALEFAKKSLALDPTYAEAFHQIGNQILDFDPQRAMAFYRRALALDPRMEMNHAGIVSALSMLGRFDEARAELASAPDRHGAWKAPARVAVAVDQHRYDEALGIVRDQKVVDVAPIVALSSVYALRMSGRRDEAMAQAAALVAKNPGYCEARAALAGLRQEKGQAAAARLLVSAALTDASSAAPSSIRCDVMSNAALNDAPAAAMLLKRIAGNAQLLWQWGQKSTGAVGGSRLLRREAFPWTHVADRPEIVEAQGVLDTAYAATRQQIAAALDPITPK